MSSKPLKILLTNDDGINAPGFRALEKIAREISDNIWVAAPQTEQSAVARSLTIRRPIQMRELSAQRYAIDGTPTDCMVVALKHLMKDNLPDLVLSGVNHGSNIGEGITYSGTVAAAMEASLRGVPAIAMSQFSANPDSINWETAITHAPALIDHLIRAPWAKGMFMNINFPDCEPGDVQGAAVVPTESQTTFGDLMGWKTPWGQHSFWIGPPHEEISVEEKSDLWAVQRNQIALTPIRVDLTHEASLVELEKVFENYTTSSQRKKAS